MRSSVLLVSFMAAAFAVPAAAMPQMSQATQAAVQIVPVAMNAGCGRGRVRDASGRCHKKFNLFHRHDRFQTYKQRRCKPVRTPNGKVGFCKV